MVVFPGDIDMPMLENLRGNCPLLLVVNLLDPAVNGKFNCLNCDFRGCANASVRHFHALGRRRIVFATSIRPKPSFHVGGLLAGYMEAVRALGLPELPVFAGDLLSTLPREDIAPFFQNVRASLLDADAVLTSTLPEALVVRELLLKAGRRIPEDVAVIGSFDSQEAADSELTTWRIPIDMIGRESVMCMERLLRNSDAPPSMTLLSLEMVRRASA